MIPPEWFPPLMFAGLVLFIDFVRPLRVPLSWINGAILRLIVGSPYGRKNIRRFAAWYKARGIDADV